MARKTIWDAFNAAGAAADAALAGFDREQRNEADAYIRNVQLRVQEEYAHHINDVENGLVSNDWDHYMNAWELRRNKLYAEVMGDSKNPYTRRALEYMFQSADARMRPAMFEAQRKMETRQQRALRADTVNRAVNAGNLNAGLEELDDSYLNGYIEFGEYVNGISNAYTGIHTAELERIIGEAVRSGNITSEKDLLDLVDGYARENLEGAELARWDARGGWRQAEGAAETPDEAGADNGGGDEEYTSEEDEAKYGKTGDGKPEWKDAQRLEFYAEIDRLNEEARKEWLKKNPEEESGEDEEPDHTGIREAVRKNNENEYKHIFRAPWWTYRDIRKLEDLAAGFDKAAEAEAAQRDEAGRGQRPSEKAPAGGRDGRSPTEGYRRVSVDTAGLNAEIARKGKDFALREWQGYVVTKQKENAANIAVEYGAALIAVTRGSAGAWDMVMRGIQTVAGIDNPLLSENDRTEYNERYARLIRTMREGGRGGLPSAITEAALKGKLAELVEQVWSGEGGSVGSLHEFHLGFKAALHQWARDEMGYTGDLEQFEAQHISPLQQYWDIARKVVRESPEAAAALGQAERYFSALSTREGRNTRWIDGKLYSGVSEHAKYAVLDSVYDELFAVDRRNVRERSVDIARSITGKLAVINGDMVEALTGRARGSEDQRLISYLKELGNPDIMFSRSKDGQMEILPGPSGDPEKLRRGVFEAWDQIGQRIADEAGLDARQLRANPTEDIKGFELEAMPEFQYGGGDRWFRMRVETAGGRERLVLEERSGRNGEWGNKTVLDQAAADREADRESRRGRREYDERRETRNRAAGNLANIEIDGQPLPMPSDYRGRTDDIERRHDFIDRYGVDKYIDFLKDYYRRPGRSPDWLPDEVRAYGR